MNRRRLIQEKYERYYIDQFITWLNRTYHTDYKVICYPNPPEAIISTSKNTMRWVEATTAFWNEEYAKDLYSLVTPHEIHKPVGPGPFQNMDIEMSKNFATVVKNKLEKKSYLKLQERYGQGYLIVIIKYPWFNELVFDKKLFRYLMNALEVITIENLGCFRSVYVAYSLSGSVKFNRWIPK